MERVRRGVCSKTRAQWSYDPRSCGCSFSIRVEKPEKFRLQQGFNPCPRIFQASQRNYQRCVHNCKDRSLTSAVQYMIHFVYHSVQRDVPSPTPPLPHPVPLSFVTPFTLPLTFYSRPSPHLLLLPLTRLTLFQLCNELLFKTTSFFRNCAITLRWPLWQLTKSNWRLVFRFVLMHWCAWVRC